MAATQTGAFGSQVLCHEAHQDAPQGWQGERAKEDQLRWAIQPSLGQPWPWITYYPGKRPQTVWGAGIQWGTSNNSYGTKTDQVIGSFVTAAAGTCLCTRSNSMCRTVYSNLIPRHGRDGHKMVKEWPSIYSRWFYKTFRQELPWTSQKNLHTSTSIPEHFQDLNARTS